ncbi:fibrous sheath CABYR-binding protein-like [Thunnus thynnus]|uniref:fibrous sheath CABYR-binding protein-like n=1 Tax=Thunnus thynnus TaxID=8237 RepID=UPI0035271D6C
MFKASSLLLVTLVLNVQLYSSAPIPGEFLQSSVVAEEQEKVAVEEGHYPEESIQKKLIPVVAGESAPSPAEKLTSEEQTAKQDIPAIEKDPEPVVIGDQVNADIDEVVSQESAPQEPLAVAPQASSEEEIAPVQPAVAEASPGETTVDVSLAVAVESESTEQHDLEAQAPAAPIPIIPSEASEDKASEENAQVEEALAVESTAEEASPEGPLLVVSDENAEVEPAASQEPLPGAEEKSVVFDPAEVKTEEAGEAVPAAEEIVPEQSGPEEPDVILGPEESAQHEPDPEEPQKTVPIFSSEAKRGEDVEEHTEEVEAAVLAVVEEKAEEPLTSNTEEEESVVLSPVELETEKGDQVEPAAEETVPQESAPEDQVVIAQVEPAEGEPDLEEQEDTVPIISSEAKQEEDVEEHAEEVEAVVPVILEGNAEEEPVTNKDLPPEQEESVVLFPVELETEDAGLAEPAAEETVPQESAPEDQVVIAPVEPAEGEPDLEEQEETVPIIFSETEKEEAPEEQAKEVEAPVPVVLEGNAEEDPATNKDLLPEEEESDVLFPVELETEDEGQAKSAAEETVPQESSPEDPAVIAPLEGEPDLEEQIEEESIPVVSPEAPEEEAPEEHAKVEDAVTVESTEMPVPILPEEDAEEEPATDERPHHSTPGEEEESIVPVTAELDSEEEGQEETEPQESAPDEPVAVVEPTNEEPAPDNPILVFPLEDSEEDGLEDNTEEGVETAVKSDPLPHDPALEEVTAPQETEPDGSDPVILTMPVTDSPSESETIKEVLGPTEGVTAAATEMLTEAPAVTDAEVEIVLSVVDNGYGTRIKKLREDFKAAIKLIKEQPVAKVSRGTVLGAAFFTLMSFIVIGYLLTTISKKLR